MEEFIKDGTLFLGMIVDAAAALIIAHAIMRASYDYVRMTARKQTDKMVIRLTLGKSLALALETSTTRKDHELYAAKLGHIKSSRLYR